MKKFLALIFVAALALAIGQQPTGAGSWKVTNVKFRTNAAAYAAPGNRDSLRFSVGGGATNIDTTLTISLLDIIDPAWNGPRATADSTYLFTIIMYPDPTEGTSTEGIASLGGVGCFVDFSGNGVNWAAAVDTTFELSPIGTNHYGKMVSHNSLFAGQTQADGILVAPVIRIRAVTGIDATDAATGSWRMDIISPTWKD